jgi:indole-3-glycerol phosphate synthase
MATTYLDEILAHHRSRAASDDRDWRRRLEDTTYAGPSFFDALSNRENGFVKVIAEVKKRSPSKGWLNADLDVANAAMTYQTGGAAAISVLTDEAYFAGSVDDLATVSRSVSLPLLRKDFTVSENDVLDTAAMGASAVLLIVAALTDAELASLFQISSAIGLTALVEVHDTDEAKRALDIGATVIGVNQRNLWTFTIDAQVAQSVHDVLPSDVLSVCESGLSSPGDVERVGEVGFDAVLVGESFVTAGGAQLATVRNFATVPAVRGD